MPRGSFDLTDRQSLWLDAMRGLAAAAVLIYHVRYRFFADWSEVPRTAANFVFYTATSFGHDAVMVFFVLSGALISRSILRAAAAGRWSWPEYGIARLSRLHVVLLPGLLLTLFWDFAGLTLFPDHVVYTGRPTGAWHDFFDVRPMLDPVIFAGNAAFLQNILVPTFGSNVPLWSLSFEFWFYVLFPLLLWAVAPGSWRTRLAYLAGAAVVAFFVGVTVLVYVPLWLLGVVLWFVPRSHFVRRHSTSLVLIALALLGGTLVACHSIIASWPLIYRDYLIGASFFVLAFVVLHLEGRAPRPGVASWVARKLAAQSYTLYVVHVPLLVFLRAALAGDSQWQPSPVTMLAAAALTALGLVYAAGVAALTETRTETVRSRMRRLLGGRGLGVVALAKPGGSVGA